MKLSPSSRIIVAAFALVGLTRGEAFAQFTPTLSATATGNQVEISWTPISIAPFYHLVASTTPGGSDIASIIAPAALFGGAPRISLTAPHGRYFLRVRAYATEIIASPFSNEVMLDVGLEPCVPGAAPALAVAVDNNTGTASASWTAVPGAASYVVQWSRSPGQTEFAETVTGTSVSRTIPMNGTFFVRVVAITNGCEPTVSNEAPFAVEVTRRHLSAGEILGIMNQVRAAYPRAFQRAHTHSAERYDYIILACRALFQAGGGTVGCNWRRAAVGDLSMDGLSIENPRDRQYYFSDAISGAGGCCPSLRLSLPVDSSNWPSSALLRDPSGRYAPWGFANPFGVAGSYPPLRTHVNYGPAGGW